MAKWKASVGGAETDYAVPGGMKALSRQMFARRLSAVCGDSEPACGTVCMGLLTVSSYTHRWLSVGYIGTPLKNGSVESSGIYQAHGGVQT